MRFQENQRYITAQSPSSCVKISLVVVLPPVDYAPRAAFSSSVGSFHVFACHTPYAWTTCNTAERKTSQDLRACTRAPCALRLFTERRTIGERDGFVSVCPYKGRVNHDVLVLFAISGIFSRVHHPDDVEPAVHVHCTKLKE